MDFRIIIIFYYTISIKRFLHYTVHFIELEGGLGLNSFLSMVLIYYFSKFFKFIIKYILILE